MLRLELNGLLALPFAEECPGDAETDEPGVADAVGVVLARVGDFDTFHVQFVVANEAVATIEAHSDGVEFETDFQFGIEGSCEGAVVAVAELSLSTVGASIVYSEDRWKSIRFIPKPTAGITLMKLFSPRSFQPNIQSAP